MRNVKQKSIVFKKIVDNIPACLACAMLLTPGFTSSHQNFGGSAPTKSACRWAFEIPFQVENKRRSGLWKGPKPVLMLGRGRVCVYEALWLPEHLVQCVEQSSVSPDDIVTDVAFSEDWSEISEPMFLII